MKFIIYVILAMLVLFCVGAKRMFAQTFDQAFNTGMNHFSLGDYTAAINTWEQLVNDPNYTEKEKAWYSIAKAGVSLKSQWGNEKAIQYLDKIINQKDTNGQPVRGQYYGDALFLIGETFFLQAEQRLNSGELVEAGTYALEAKKHFDLLLAEIPDSSNKLQVLYYQTQIAVKYLQSAVETKRYAELALNISGALQANQEIYNNCMFYYAWAIGQSGNRNDIDTARRIFGDFITNKDPKRGPMSLYELAHTYFRAGEYQKALDELNRFTSVFPNETATSTFLDVRRLQASCYFHLEKYAEATSFIDQVIKQLPESSVSFQDFVFVSLCYMKTQNFNAANDFITYLESKYANNLPYSDGLKFLRAAYYAEQGQYQNAVNLLGPILGVRQDYTGGITFDKLPRNSEKTGVEKCGLTEEYYLRAASLLAICYAKSGNMTVARQVYDAMFRVSQEMYGRFSSIREKTLSQLNEIERSIQAGSFIPPSPVTSTLATPITTPGTGSTSVVVASPASVLQSGGSNPLTWAMSPAEQEREINKLQALADYARENKEYIDSVLADLNLLLEHNSSLTEYNIARVAILKGELQYHAKSDVATAIEMSELAYELIVEGVANGREDKRNTDTFVRAARALGRNAAARHDYEAAAKYFLEAYITSVGKDDKYRSELLYRYGASLLNIPNKRMDALGCFTEIDRNEKTSSNFWSHAALQLAIDDFKNRDYDLCEEKIDELIEVMPDKAILDRVLYLKGELALQNRQWDIAADSFDAVCMYATDSSLANSASYKRSEALRQGQVTR